jgi:hypothetical protein
MSVAPSTTADNQSWQVSTPGLAWSRQASVESAVERFETEHASAKCIYPEFVSIPQPGDIVFQIPAVLRLQDAPRAFGFLFTSTPNDHEVITIPVRYVSDSIAFKILMLNLIEDNFPATHP